ncbi:predicted protein [Nematostella vectensis]|uniref:SAP30-binding protein n=1 Tax=Nematostella vectensis TaxID=45351 RepID=A7SFM7_NEMVE|nr:predicted protein [Nematostella vectensis]|eukprot:XP_001629588.1 predicted protein [Nematostella vectensis]
MASLLSLADYGLGDSDIEDSDEEASKGEPAVITTLPKVHVSQPRVVTNSSRLVSYGDEDEEDGKLNESMEVEELSTELQSLVQDASQAIPENQAVAQRDKNENEEPAKDSAYAEVHLPPEPVGRCSNSLQDKISNLLEKKYRTNKDWNAAVQKRKDFRNPSIYEKLISYCNIQENGTNYPKELFNPEAWLKEPTYEVLAKQQKEAYEKREKAKRTHIEFMSGTKKTGPASDDAKKRKSKWDVSSTGVTKTVTPPVPPGVGIVPGLAKVISEAAATAAKKAKVDN